MSSHTTYVPSASPAMLIGTDPTIRCAECEHPIEKHDRAGGVAACSWSDGGYCHCIATFPFADPTQPDTIIMGVTFSGEPVRFAYRVNERGDVTVTADNSVEKVDHPAHYGGADDPYEVVKVCEAWGLDADAYLFQAVKYIARAGKKPGEDAATDLGKAAWYIQRRIDHPLDG